ncbi:MAG: hypothetical protein ACJ790_18460 [Myxococcaceae bacterium]
MKRASLLALIVSSAAAAQGYGGGTQPGGLDGGAAVQDVTSCTACHDRQATDDPTLYLPYDGWASSMMGNAMRDPLFLAAVSVANQDSPGIGSYCIRCHSPQAWVRGHASPSDGGALDGIDRQGISCEACHRAVPSEDGGFLHGNAQLFWDLTGIKLGPYENIDSPAHYGKQSALNSDSSLCGQCHQIENPNVAFGDGGFPLDTTYEEWTQSAFSSGSSKKGCIDCHMKTYAGSHAVANGGPDRLDPRRHSFTGGNLFGLAAVQAANPAYATALADEFEETRKLTEETLSQAAALTLSAPSEPDGGAKVEVTVKVQNLTGHKLPTGYADGRRVYLEVTVNGAPVSGYYDADAGTLLPDPQLRVYEAFHGRTGQGREEHLALHDMVVKDSRIPPKGMIANEETRPVGVTWFDLPGGGLRDYDEATYVIDAPAPGRTAEIKVRLLYQSTTREYVKFLANENVSDTRGAELAAIYEQVGGSPPIEMAVATATVTNPPPPTLDGSPGQCIDCCCEHVQGGAVSAVAVMLFIGLVGGRRGRRERVRGR